MHVRWATGRTGVCSEIHRTTSRELSRDEPDAPYVTERKSGRASASAGMVRCHRVSAAAGLRGG